VPADPHLLKRFDDWLSRFRATEETNALLADVRKALRAESVAVPSQSLRAGDAFGLVKNAEVLETWAAIWADAARSFDVPECIMIARRIATRLREIADYPAVAVPSSALTLEQNFDWRALATMLGHLARDMKRRKHAHINVPQTCRDGTLSGFDRFSVEQVEEAELEAERLARLSE
jgi:hypothetical protein